MHITSQCLFSIEVKTGKTPYMLFGKAVLNNFCCFQVIMTKTVLNLT